MQVSGPDNLFSTMKTFTLCCTLLGLVVLGTRGDRTDFTRPGHRKDWPEIDRLGAFADTIDWFTKFEERVYLVTKDDRVYAFGKQPEYQRLLGVNMPEGVNDPTEIVELRGKKIIKIASSYDHTLALSADGRVWAWGDNDEGQLGVGSTARHDKPVPVEKITNVVDIVTADMLSLALTKSGQVFAWGYNANNECGIGDHSTKPSSPVRVHLNQTAPNLHTTYGGASVVLAANSQLYVWGPEAAAVPTLVQVPSKIVSVVSTYYNYHLLTEEGHIWRGVSNQLTKVEPYYQGATKFKALYAGPVSEVFLLAEATDGKLWMWANAEYVKPPVLINEKDIVKAFAVHHHGGFLPFVVKLGGGGASTKTPTTSRRIIKTPTTSRLSV